LLLINIIIIIVLLGKYYPGDQTNKEMGGECGMYGRQERFIEEFGGEA